MAYATQRRTQTAVQANRILGGCGGHSTYGYQTKAVRVREYVRAASRVALDDTEVSTGGVGLTAGWGSPAVGVFLHTSFAHGAPCFPVPTVAANRHYPHGRCCTIARRSDYLQACVCVASSHHFPCVPAVCLCVAWLASTFLALWPSCSACVRACCSALGLPLPGPPLRGWCRHRGFA